MNKVSKIITLILCIGIVVASITYATTKILENNKEKANLIPTYTSSIGNNDINSVWVGSFQIAWNEFMDKRVNGKVEFEDGESLLANELNKKMFSKEMLSEEDYYIKVDKTSNELKNEILSDINSKFGISDSSALNQIDFNVDSESNSYTIYSVLYKNFEFLKPFDRLYGTNFNDSEEIVRYFGINNASSEELNNNIEVLFYNNNSDFAIKLKTKENEDVILYCNDSNNSFNNLYNEVVHKSQLYNGNNEFLENDELKVPYINLDTIINYRELCGRGIKGTLGLYLTNAVQNVKFSLNEIGGNLVSEATIKDECLGISENSRFFYYNKPFVVFLKESDKDNPYFALKVNNTDLLVKSDLYGEY